MLFGTDKKVKKHALTRAGLQTLVRLIRYNDWPKLEGRRFASPRMTHPRILILTVPHGAAHDRLADALRKALVEIQPALTIQVVDALEHCAPWFRHYYNSYEIPLRYWPSLWGLIEYVQQRANSTNPAWLYRRGGRPLLRYIEAFDPNIVVATEVGLCELTALFKREGKGEYYLVGTPAAADSDRAWIQREVDLYPVAPGEMAARLVAAGVSPSKITTCGLIVDPAFDSLPDRAACRARLAVEPDTPLVLVLFGGTGFGKPKPIVDALGRVRRDFQTVFIAGKNRRLEEELRLQCQDRPRFRVLGWVDNMHEWMAAADLLISKPGAATLAEAMTSGLPLLAIDPLPGNERRACDLIEKWGVGIWMKQTGDLAPTLERLLINRRELQLLRDHCLALARPRAAREAAQAILNLISQRAQTRTRSGW